MLHQQQQQLQMVACGAPAGEGEAKGGVAAVEASTEDVVTANHVAPYDATFACLLLTRTQHTVAYKAGSYALSVRTVCRATCRLIM